MTTRLNSGLGAICAAVGLAVTAIGPAHAATIPIVNGGFETGDFTGWTLSGNSGFMGVQCPGPGPTVFQGNCSAFAGPVGSLGFLSQSFATTVGQVINVTAAWEPDGGTPSEFSIEFDVGTPQARTVLDSVNHAASGFLVPTARTIALLPITTVTFNFRDDPGFIFFDGVSAATPEPGSIALLGMGLAGLWAARRRKTS